MATRKSETYIVLFRGVGGPTQLPTAPLRQALAEAGFEQVTTYINSGNAIVRASLSREAVIAKIAELCASKFGFTKAIFALKLGEWSKLIDANPFPEAVSVPKYLHAAVLEKKPRAADVAAIAQHAVKGERLTVVDKVAYLHTPHGFGTSKFAATFDKGIAVVNTARNWNTVLKLRELAARAADG